MSGVLLFATSLTFSFQQRPNHQGGAILLRLAEQLAYRLGVVNFQSFFCRRGCNGDNFGGADLRCGRPKSILGSELQPARPPDVASPGPIARLAPTHLMRSVAWTSRRHFQQQALPGPASGWLGWVVARLISPDPARRPSRSPAPAQAPSSLPGAIIINSPLTSER